MKPQTILIITGLAALAFYMYKKQQTASATPTGVTTYNPNGNYVPPVVTVNPNSNTQQQNNAAGAAAQLAYLQTHYNPNAGWGNWQNINFGPTGGQPGGGFLLPF